MSNEIEILQEAIDSFRNGSFHGETALGAGKYDIEDLQQPDIADGNCLNVTVKFTNFLREQHELDAYVGMPGDAASMFGAEMNPDAWGYQDRPIIRWNSHVASTCRIGDDLYMIDWTAAQYGYKQFPLIQIATHIGSPPRWERLSQLTALAV